MNLLFEFNTVAFCLLLTDCWRRMTSVQNPASSQQATLCWFRVNKKISARPLGHIFHMPSGSWESRCAPTHAERGKLVHSGKARNSSYLLSREQLVLSHEVENNMGWMFTVPGLVRRDVLKVSVCSPLFLPFSLLPITCWFMSEKNLKKKRIRILMNTWQKYRFTFWHRRRLRITADFPFFMEVRKKWRTSWILQCISSHLSAPRVKATNGPQDNRTWFRNKSSVWPWPQDQKLSSTRFERPKTPKIIEALSHYKIEPRRHGEYQWWCSPDLIAPRTNEAVYILVSRHVIEKSFPEKLTSGFSGPAQMALSSSHKWGASAWF